LAAAGSSVAFAGAPFPEAFVHIYLRKDVRLIAKLRRVENDRYSKNAYFGIFNISELEKDIA